MTDTETLGAIILLLATGFVFSLIPIIKKTYHKKTFTTMQIIYILGGIVAIALLLLFNHSAHSGNKPTTFP